VIALVATAAPQTGATALAAAPTVEMARATLTNMPDDGGFPLWLLLIPAAAYMAWSVWRRYRTG